MKQKYFNKPYNLNTYTQNKKHIVKVKSAKKENLNDHTRQNDCASWKTRN